MESPIREDTDDHALMRRVGQGDREALAALVRRHQERVLALAYRFLGRWHAAEDVCQDAFIRTFEAAPRYEPTAAFTTWLYRVVANLCWEQRRRGAPEPEPLTAESELAESSGTTAEVDRLERRALIRRAVGRLPDRQRLVLILHRYENLRHKEIVDVTGWSAGAVESCLVRAYSRLRKELADLDRG